MKPAGIILTFMKWRSKWFLFNLGLFAWQMIFLIMGTIYGKIKRQLHFDRHIKITLKVLSMIILIVSLSGLAYSALSHHYWIFPLWITFVLFGGASYRDINWIRVWRAAQVCHVRLCLKQLTSLNIYSLSRIEYSSWEYISFGYPEAEIKPWRMDMMDGSPTSIPGRWRYYDPTFDPSDKFIATMIQYAYDQEGKPYDVPQLASYALNLAIWIVCPWTWGREIVSTFNKPGGHESCSSGVTADLRWAEDMSYHRELGRPYPLENPTDYFEGYDTAMVSPCLFELSENWRGR